jgi:ubiquinone/menaquinone biosynthesis C-methylase UbiE
MPTQPPPIVHALRFRWLNPAYDLVVAATTRERAVKAALLAQARIEPEHRVLDLASGTGTLAILAKHRQPRAEVVGIDADPAIISIARSKALRARVDVRFDEGYSTALPYGDATFDRVLSSLFFHHLSRADKQATLAEAYRVLRPGGELHVADWGKASGPAMRFAFLAIQLLDGFANTQDNVDGRLEPMFGAAGFTAASEAARFGTVYLGAFPRRETLGEPR